MLPLVELRVEFASTRVSSRTSIAAPATSTCRPSTRRRRGSRWRENRAVFQGYAGAGIGGLVRPAGTNRSRSRRPEPVPRRGGPCRRRPARGRHRRARTVSRSRRRSTPRSSKPPSTAAIRCSTTSTRSSRGRSCGRPVSTGGLVMSLRGGDFVFELRSGHRHRLRRPRRRATSPCISKELQLPGARTRRRRRPRPAAGLGRGRALRGRAGRRREAQLDVRHRPVAVPADEDVADHGSRRSTASPGTRPPVSGSRW